MSKEYLCICNKCNTIMFDENPNVLSEKREVTSDMIVHEMKQFEDEKGYFWGCPECETDDCLRDF